MHSKTTCANCEAVQLGRGTRCRAAPSKTIPLNPPHCWHEAPMRAPCFCDHLLPVIRAQVCFPGTTPNMMTARTTPYCWWAGAQRRPVAKTTGSPRTAGLQCGEHPQVVCACCTMLPMLHHERAVWGQQEPVVPTCAHRSCRASPWRHGMPNDCTTHAVLRAFLSVSMPALQGGQGLPAVCPPRPLAPREGPVLGRHLLSQLPRAQLTSPKSAHMKRP